MQVQAAFALALCLLALCPEAHADETTAIDPLEIEPPYLDVAPLPLYPLAASGAGGVELGAGVTVVRRPQGHDLAGTVTLSIPIDGFASPRKAKELAEPEPTAAEDEQPTGSHLERAPRSYATLPRIRPRDARSAIAAALLRRKLDQSDERVDGLSTRARWSALLPELRLRATRLLDESTSLSPTSYDPERTTTRGGASLWLEARASWRLDRLVFADEEVRIERLRQRLDSEREAIMRQTLQALFAWQRAASHSRDPMLDPAQCIEAWLDEQQRAAELDVLTAGWLTRWQQRQTPLPDPPCLAADDIEE